MKRYIHTLVTYALYRPPVSTMSSVNRHKVSTIPRLTTHEAPVASVMRKPSAVGSSVMVEAKSTATVSAIDRPNKIKLVSSDISR